jgi:hypothetical protein
MTEQEEKDLDARMDESKVNCEAIATAAQGSETKGATVTPNQVSDERCINCQHAFAATEARCYFGAPDKQVGPLCATCDRIVKMHTRFALLQRY